MELDKYKMKLLGIPTLPDEATPRTTLELTKQEVARQSHIDRNQVKANILKLYHLASVVDCYNKIGDKQLYSHYYTLLHQFMSKRR